MLTDKAIKAAKPAERQYKLSDEKGLFMLVTPAGGRLWRFKYRVNGIEKSLALGSYPEVTLADARSARDAARQRIAAGGDPAREKKLAKLKKLSTSELTFEVVST
jgi:hypothetical protein